MEGIFTGIKWDEVPFSEIVDAGKLARATIVNRYEGGIEAEGTLEYLLVYCPGKPVTFSGLERLQTQDGTMVLKHEGTFSAEQGVSGVITIVEGMGTGSFSGLTGSGTITSKPGEHHGNYVLTVQSGNT